MKKLLSLSVATLALAAMADGYNAIQVGVTEISATTKNVVIPVPYTTIGSSEPVSVHDLVKVANLPDRTLLYYFDSTSGSYNAWMKNSNGDAWDGVEVVKESGITAAAGTSEINIPVGNALWVVFPSVPSSDQKIYVYGNPTTPSTTAIARGKANLIGNPTSAQFSLAGKVNNPTVGDKIIDLTAEVYTEYVFRGENVWWKREGSTVIKDATLPSIPANGGIWYISAVADGENQSINWASN